MTAKSYFSILLFPILLAACQSKQPGKTRAFRYDDFMFLDSLKNTKAVFKWSSTELIMDTSFFGNKGNIKDTVKVSSEVGGIDTLVMNGEIVYAVRLYSKPDGWDCHPCGSLCQVSFFRKTSLAIPAFVTSATISNESGNVFGSFGYFPEINLIRIGDRKYAYQVEPGFTNMGQTQSSILLFGISDSLGIAGILSFENASDDNSGMCDDTLSDHLKCYSYDTKIEYKRAAGAYYQINATKKGTDLIDDKIINIDSAFLYEYRNGKYEVIETKAK